MRGRTKRVNFLSRYAMPPLLPLPVSLMRDSPEDGEDAHNHKSKNDHSSCKRRRQSIKKDAHRLVMHSDAVEEERARLEGMTPDEGTQVH